MGKKLSERVAAFNKVKGMREYARKNKISRNISIPLFEEEGNTVYARLVVSFNTKTDNFSIGHSLRWHLLDFHPTTNQKLDYNSPRSIDLIRKHREYNRRRCIEKREEKSDYQKDYYLNNKERVKERNKRFYEKNRGRYLKKSLNYQKKNSKGKTMHTDLFYADGYMLKSILSIRLNLKTEHVIYNHALLWKKHKVSPTKRLKIQLKTKEDIDIINCIITELNNLVDSLDIDLFKDSSSKGKIVTIDDRSYRLQVSVIDHQLVKKWQEKYTRSKGSVPINENKGCNLYTGVYIAESVIERLFKNAKRMPFGNKGYDIICDKGLKIDVKSATLNGISVMGKHNGSKIATNTIKKGWKFGIDKNKMADYFICIAFDNRENLYIKYIWVFKGDEPIIGNRIKRKVNERTTIAITEELVEKYKYHELDKDKIEEARIYCSEIKTGKLENLSTNSVCNNATDNNIDLDKNLNDRDMVHIENVMKAEFRKMIESLSQNINISKNFNQRSKTINFENASYKLGITIGDNNVVKKLGRESRHRTEGLRPLGDNKYCSLYVGVYIAESLLEKIFENAKRMPFGNKGYDFICGKGFKIDVKCSAMCDIKTVHKIRNKEVITYKKGWKFNIRRNKIADYFLCIAIDDRDNLNIIYIWLIKGDERLVGHRLTKKFNDRMNFSIFCETADAYKYYEIDKDRIEDARLCCSKFKEETI